MAKIKRKVYESRLKDLKKATRVAAIDHDTSDYLHGMSNGLVLAKAIMTGTRPVYFEGPTNDSEDTKKESGLAPQDNMVENTYSGGERITEAPRPAGIVGGGAGAQKAPKA